MRFIGPWVSLYSVTPLALSSRAMCRCEGVATVSISWAIGSESSETRRLCVPAIEVSKNSPRSTDLSSIPRSSNT
jgi:hypothetical protein